MKSEDVPLAHAGMASEFELQKEYYNKAKIFILQIESTLRCPQLCDYCYAGSKPDSSEGMSSEKIKELLDSAAKLDVRMIDWLGGDPLVRSDWYELCQYASKLGFINNATNPIIATRKQKPNSIIAAIVKAVLVCPAFLDINKRWTVAGFKDGMQNIKNWKGNRKNWIKQRESMNFVKKSYWKKQREALITSAVLNG